MGWTKYAMNAIVAAKKSNIKEIVWNARGGYSKTANRQPSH